MSVQEIEVAGFKPGVLKAAADLSAKQFFAVKLDANGDVVLSGDGDLSLGILQNAPILGEACEIEMDGISKTVAGAAVAIGAEVAANAAGKLITAVAGKRVVAVALQAAAGDLSVFSTKVIGLSGRAVV